MEPQHNPPKRRPEWHVLVLLLPAVGHLIYLTCVGWLLTGRYKDPVEAHTVMMLHGYVSFAASSAVCLRLTYWWSCHRPEDERVRWRLEWAVGVLFVNYFVMAAGCTVPTLF
jgi:hypothetical protein